MGKIRGRDYISWLWLYTAPYAGRIGLLLLFGLLETFASLAMVQITKEIIDAAANLKVIGVCSVGLNHVDMDACLRVMCCCYWECRESRCCRHCLLHW